MTRLPQHPDRVVFEIIQECGIVPRGERQQFAFVKSRWRILVADGGFHRS